MEVSSHPCTCLNEICSKIFFAFNTLATSVQHLNRYTTLIAHGYKLYNYLYSTSLNYYMT